MTTVLMHSVSSWDGVFDSCVHTFTIPARIPSSAMRTAFLRPLAKASMAAMWAMNRSSMSVDSLRTLASKFNPPGCRPPCSTTVCSRRDSVTETPSRRPVSAYLHDQGGVPDVHGELIRVPPQVRGARVCINWTQQAKSVKKAGKVAVGVAARLTGAGDSRRRHDHVVFVGVSCQGGVVGLNV